MVESAQHVDRGRSLATFGPGRVDSVVLVFRLRIHRLGPRFEKRLDREMIQRFIHASQPVVDAHFHAG